MMCVTCGELNCQIAEAITVAKKKEKIVHKDCGVGESNGGDADDNSIVQKR